IFAFGLVVNALDRGEVARENPIVGLAKGMPRAYFYVLVFMAVFVAPFCEETFFRGFLQSQLQRRMPTAVAVVLQCLLFGAVHTFGLLHSAWAFFIGLFLTAVSQWRKSLLCPALVHAGVNLLATLAAFAALHALENRPYLGVQGHAVEHGVAVDAVVEDSPAAKAHIAAGDVIVELEGSPV